jgi:hypothetical protein
MFVKAWARVAERWSELRQMYMARPIPRIYEHGTSIAAVVVEREIEGERGLLLARLIDPSARSLSEIDDWLRRCKTQPIAAVRDFRHAARFARFPWFLRRFLWNLAMRWRPTLRATQIGTFGISVTAGLGATGWSLRIPWTTCLHYGVLEPDGRLSVRLTFDHRVFDGTIAAHALADLESVLLNEIISELNDMAHAAAA